MEKIMLQLKPGAVLIEENGQMGLTLSTHSRFAKNKEQATLVGALSRKPQLLNDLIPLLSSCIKTPVREADIPLIIAEFILDFGAFLED